MGKYFKWSQLRQLKVLSLHPEIIRYFDHLRGPTLFKFLTACPSLEELEICISDMEFLQCVYIILKFFFWLLPITHYFVYYTTLNFFQFSSNQGYYIVGDSRNEFTVCNNLKKVTINFITLYYTKSNSQSPSFLEQVIYLVFLPLSCSTAFFNMYFVLFYFCFIFFYR